TLRATGSSARSSRSAVASRGTMVTMPRSDATRASSGLWRLALAALLSACSSTSQSTDGAASDGPSTDASAPTGAAPKDAAAKDAAGKDAAGKDAAAPVDAAVAGDGGAPQLVWFPGNYGLVTTGNDAARNAFLTGAFAGPFDGVEMIYPWTTCETAMGNY